MKKDLLAVVKMKPLGTWEVVKIIFRGFTKSLDSAERLDSFCTAGIDIETRKREQTVALDGEIFKMVSPFEIKSLPETLNLVLPPKDAVPPS